MVEKQQLYSLILTNILGKDRTLPGKGDEVENGYFSKSCYTGGRNWGIERQ